MLRRVFQASPSSYSKLCAEIVSKYICTGVIPKGTLVGNIIDMGLSPLGIMLSDDKIALPKPTMASGGLIDSISFLLKHHLRPYDDNQQLLYNLT